MAQVLKEVKESGGKRTDGVSYRIALQNCARKSTHSDSGPIAPGFPNL